MTVKLDLSPELDSQIQALASDLNLSVEEYLAGLIQEAVPRKRHDSALALLDAWTEEDTTDDPAELAKRRGDWERFKSAMNEGHPSDRVLFP